MAHGVGLAAAENDSGKRDGERERDRRRKGERERERERERGIRRPGRQGQVRRKEEGRGCSIRRNKDGTETRHEAHYGAAQFVRVVVVCFFVPMLLPQCGVLRPRRPARSCVTSCVFDGGGSEASSNALRGDEVLSINQLTLRTMGSRTAGMGMKQAGRQAGRQASILACLNYSKVRISLERAMSREDPRDWGGRLELGKCSRRRAGGRNRGLSKGRWALGQRLRRESDLNEASQRTKVDTGEWGLIAPGTTGRTGGRTDGRTEGRRDGGTWGSKEIVEYGGEKRGAGGLVEQGRGVVWSVFTFSLTCCCRCRSSSHWTD